MRITKIQKLFLAAVMFLGLLSVDSFGMALLRKKAEAQTPISEQSAGEQKAKVVSDTSLGQKRVAVVREMSLAREEKRQEKNAGIDTRSLQEIESETGADLFTQTEAYFQIPDLRKLVTTEFGGSFQPVLHMDTISRVMAKEAAFRNTHWAFYHAISNVWTVPQDVYTRLYNYANPSTQKSSEDFTFLRFGDQEGPLAKEFLVNELKENGLVDDNGEARGLLLSCNFSIFGNTGLKSECTWNYFMKEKAHTVPDRSMYEEILAKFGMSYTYVDELMELVDLLRSREQTLLQIFVPKDDIDDVGYLAWATGIPAHQASIDWIQTNLKNRVFKGKKGKPGALWALADLKDTFKKEQERNPLFREMLKNVEKGDYSLNSFLKVYCNKPWELPNLNNVQARLIFSNDVLLNPESGVKMFRHTTIPDNKMETYKKRLDEIMRKIVAEKQSVNSVE